MSFLLAITLNANADLFNLIKEPDKSKIITTCATVYKNTDPAKKIVASKNFHFRFK